MNYKVKTKNFETNFRFIDCGQLFLDDCGKPYITTAIIRQEDGENLFNAIALSDGELRLFDMAETVWIPTTYNLEIEM